MNTNKLKTNINNRRALKESLKKDIDSRLDEILGRVKPTSTAATAAGTQRGGLGAMWKRFKDDKIGTADDYRFGYRKGFTGKTAQMKAKRDAMRHGVANPDYDAEMAAKMGDKYREPERVFGQSAWDVSKRKQKDVRLQRGRATFGDHFKMAYNPQKFADQYAQRHGGALPPGFEQEGPMKSDFATRWGKRASGQPMEKSPGRRYMDVTTPNRANRAERQRMQARRLAGDEDAVATARRFSGRAVGPRGKDAPADYAYTAGTPETETIRKSERVPGQHPAFSQEGGDRRFRDVEVGTGRMNRPTGVSRTGRPISRGGVAWHQVGKEGDQGAEVDVERMPDPGERPLGIERGAGALQRSGRGYHWGSESGRGLPRQLPRGADDPPRLRMSNHPKTKRLRRLGTISRKRKDSSTIYTGSTLSEMLRRRLRHA